MAVPVPNTRLWQSRGSLRTNKHNASAVAFAVGEDGCGVHQDGEYANLHSETT